MEFKITSKCGKYVGKLIGHMVCEVSLADKQCSHWFFDYISNDPSGWTCSEKKYGIYNQYGMLIDMYHVNSPQMIQKFNGEERSFGWYCYMDNMRDIVDDFDTMFKWLDTGIDQFNEVINN